MIKTLVIDDEIFVRKEIKNLLKTHFENDIVVLGEADSVKEGLLLVETLKPELIFLDIQLLDGTGFDILEQANFKDYRVIFITAFNEHAIKAIKVGAMDYILKPIDKLEFVGAVNKTLDYIDQELDSKKLIEIVSDRYRERENRQLVLRTAKTFYVVSEHNILYCKADGNYTIFHTKDQGAIMITQPLTKMHALLSQDDFIRCHHSYLVNKNHAKKYDKKGVLTLADDIKIPVSGRKLKEVLAQIFNKP